MKKIFIGLGIAAILAGCFLTANALTCTNVFPTALNGYSSSSCIASSWANALENKLGINRSTATSTLDYQINHIFTSYGSEQIASSSLNLVSSTFAQNADNLSKLLSTSTALANLGGVPLTRAINTTAPISGGGNLSVDRTLSLQLGGNTMQNCSAGQFSNSLTATGTIGCATPAGSVTLAGTDSQVQYNASSTLGATSTFSFGYNNPQLLALSSPSSSLQVGNLSSFNTNLLQSTSFSYTGASTTWTVPAGVTAVRITAIGGGGGGGQGGGTGGGGGIATGTISVTPNTTYYVFVGQVGSTTSSGTGGPGGLGGGAGGAGGTSTSGGGGGGGATWISTAPSFTSSTAVLVAAGGGGSAGVNGGDAGYSSGVAGKPGAGATGGGGGSQTAGGTGGFQNGATSTTPNGGTGGVVAPSGGGGGGGGYFGGGGGGVVAGANNSGGGGGSNFFSSGFSATSTATSSGNGSLLITYYLLSTTTPSFSVLAGDHIITGGVVAPSVSSCGTSPSILGNDTAGKITAGSGTVTSCTMTFGHQWAAAPSCVFGDNTIATSTTITTTSSTMVIGALSLTSHQLMYHCLGY